MRVTLIQEMGKMLIQVLIEERITEAWGLISVLATDIKRRGLADTQKGTQK